MDPPHLEIENISKSVIRKVDGAGVSAQILSDIALTIRKGELVTIMGTSGSGKSTLLRLINRLSEADSGVIMLSGKDIRDYPPTQLRKKIGMVFQVPVMFKGSVRDNLASGMKIWGNHVDIGTLASDVGIPEKLLDADSKKLSVGEKQRVCIARALANQPEVLLLDEPTSSLDSGSARRIEELLLDMSRKQHITMLWVTHEKAQAERIGGRRFILKDGRLKEENEEEWSGGETHDRS